MECNRHQQLVHRRKLVVRQPTSVHPERHGTFLDSHPVGNLPHDYDLIAPTQISSINATAVSIGRVQATNLGDAWLTYAVAAPASVQRGLE